MVSELSLRLCKGVDGGLLSDTAVQGLDTTMSTPLRPSSQAYGLDL